MEKNLRQERLASTIHAATAEFFLENSRDWGIHALALVEQVFVSPDLHHVEIWVSLSPWKPEKAEAEFEKIQRHLGALKKSLSERLELRRFPEVVLKLADPEKTFRILDILGTISGHDGNGSTHQGDDSSSQEDSTDSPR